jgi:hypothetical protein
MEMFEAFGRKQGKGKKKARLQTPPLESGSYKLEAKVKAPADRQREINSGEDWGAD